MGAAKDYIILKYAKEQSISVVFPKLQRRDFAKEFTKGQGMLVNLQNNRTYWLA